MPWFRSLRDDFTLSPFENPQDAPSDSAAAMASVPPDVSTNDEAAEVSEECSGKKKSKFQTFKKFFCRKKRKEPSASGDLKGSQSSDNLSKTSENHTLSRSEKDKGSGSKVNLGGKALSHDSVFVSDSSEANEALGASQDSLHGKVKSLQMQLKQAMRLGSPPSIVCVKRTEDAGTVSEDDGLPCSPPEYNNKTKAQRDSSVSLDSDEDQLSCPGSSRVRSPLVAAPGDFSSPASPLVCLDNSAARHKLGLRQKACNRRKPASRLELRTEPDSVLEDTLNRSRPEETQVKVIADAELKSEEDKPASLSNGPEDREGQGTEPEQDLSHEEDSVPQPCVPDQDQDQDQDQEQDQDQDLEDHREDTEDQDSPRSSPEPPAGHREYLLDPPGFNYGSENKLQLSDSSLDEKLGEDISDEDEKPLKEEEEEEEEESSLLQEVLSSLKTPLTSLETEQDVPHKDDHQGEHREEGETTEEDAMEEEEEAIVVSPESAEEDKDVVEVEDEQEEVEPEKQEVEPEKQEVEPEKPEAVVSFYKDADDEMKSAEETEEDEEEEEEPVVEHFRQSDLVQEIKKDEIQEESQHEEESALPTTQSDREEEEMQEDANITFTELEKEDQEEVEEVLDKTEQEVVESEEEDHKTEAAILENEQEEEEIKETSGDDEEEMTVEMREKGVDKEFEQEIETQDFANVAEVVSEESFEAEKDLVEDESGEVEEGDGDQKEIEEEEEMEVERADTEENDEDEAVETFREGVIQENGREDSTEEKFKPLSFNETSKITTATTTLHINLVSPTAEKFSCPFTEDLKEEKAEEKMEETQEMSLSETEETPGQENPQTEVSGRTKPEQSRPRFTIAPAWQRSLSIGDKDETTTSSPSTPPVPSVSTSVPGHEGQQQEEDEEKTEGEDREELVLSPTRAKNSGILSDKMTTEESPVAAEGNSQNPFGVRLRRTQALQRFIAEDEHSEPVHEPPAQSPTSPTNQQPISIKPAAPIQPISIKPAAPTQPISIKPTVPIQPISIKPAAPIQPISIKPTVPIQPISIKPAAPSQPISIKPKVPIQPISMKPAVPKKPEMESGGKTKRVSDPGPGSDAPSWISVAKQKQKTYKESSVENIAVTPEEPEETRSSLSPGQESCSRVNPSELHKPPAPLEKDSRRSLSPPTPVPPQQPPKPCHSCPSPVSPKPLSPPPASVTTSSTSSRPVPVQSPPPRVTSPQDEPPWMALAKKKAKAWSEMPQIVQ